MNNLAQFFAKSPMIVIALIVALIFVIIHLLRKKASYFKLYIALRAERENEQREGRTALLNAKSLIEKERNDAQRQLSKLQESIGEALEAQETFALLAEKRKADYSVADEKAQEMESRLLSLKNKYSKNKSLIESVLSSIKNYSDAQQSISMPSIEELNTLFEVEYNSDLKALTIKELRSQIRRLQKQIKSLFEQYEERYTTKQNKSIYFLVVLALEEGVKNIYHSMAFGKLDKAIDAFQALSSRLLNIAAKGNQLIAPTLLRFLGQIEYLYIEYLKTEYEYYVKCERAKEEQRAIREQMRQEIEERKLLEAQRKAIENEEKKYIAEIARLQEQVQQTSEASTLEMLQNRLREVEALLQSVDAKKAEIIRLQNGKAGTVYVISNLGSFGDNMFKVGMTRRLEPMDRVRELGDASVPFPFDVHSFIFSEDAVTLENRLHKELSSRRVNKINLRKEFFHISINELEDLVNMIEPSAPFERTMLAEQYHQSLSINEVPEFVDTNVATDDNPDDE